MKKFDLNIEKILENWTISDALREIISNAIDETLIKKCKKLEIYKDYDEWIIRDFGRGLNYKHLTQNENLEKQLNKMCIGKFGVGLKDSFATLNRNNIEFQIKSKHNLIKIAFDSKGDFQDTETLHALIYNVNCNENFIGTEFRFFNLNDIDVFEAKNKFVMFNDSNIIESNFFGEIIKKDNEIASIYFNGLKIANEKDFLYSYNITNPNSQIIKALNRERANVGRAAYTTRIKDILINSKNESISKNFINNIQDGNGSSDEIKWIDVKIHFIKKAENMNQHVFVSQEQLNHNPNMLTQIREHGKKAFIEKPSTIKKLFSANDIQENGPFDYDSFIDHVNESCEYEFINEEKLSKNQLKVWKNKNKILNIFKEYLDYEINSDLPILLVKEIKNISIDTTLGLSDGDKIILALSTLVNNEVFCSTLIHELIHHYSGFVDSTREFENELTKIIGTMINRNFFQNDN